VSARAHCDALDGPVVVEAKAALEKGDATPLLKWVRAQDEAEIRSAFAETLAVRKLSPQAKALADRSFFETLVRVHRAGEGFGFTGLKPAGRISPPNLKSDAALANNDIEPFLKMVLEHAGKGVRERFAKAAQARAKQGESVEAGRNYVSAYVEYTHYVEAMVMAVHGKSSHPAPAAAPAHGH
jgi:hypothetical protein